MIGNPICFSTNSTYFLQFSGRSSYFFDSADVAFPSRQSLQNRFCFLKQCSCRKFCCYFSINLISCADRNFIQISKNIKNCESNICSSLKTASVFGCNTVEPSHTSRTACSSTKFTAVTATSSQFICFIAKDSETNAPAPTALEYALHTVTICLISYGGRPAPTAPYPARVEEDVPSDKFHDPGLSENQAVPQEELLYLLLMRSTDTGIRHIHMVQPFSYIP